MGQGLFHCIALRVATLEFRTIRKNPVFILFDDGCELASHGWRIRGLRSVSKAETGNPCVRTCSCLARKHPSARRRKALEWWVSLRENSHLRRRTDHRIFRADGQKADVVAETHGGTICPILKFRACPLEGMVAVAELAGKQSFPFHVIFAIGGCDNDGFRFGALEQHAFKCGESLSVKMLNHFHHGGRLETREPLVAVNE